MLSQSKQKQLTVVFYVGIAVAVHCVITLARGSMNQRDAAVKS
jgi:hypothetical protein